jgi:nucleotide-binding universal stress UspA family protein
MTSITHVLCAVDFSEFSRRAIDHAAAIARWYRARLTVLHVVRIQPIMDLPPAPMSGADRERMLADVTRFTRQASPDIPFDIQVEEASSVPDEILRQTQALGADLLVVGSHGASGFERLLLGSVTERIAHKVLCPTMVVPRHAADKDPHGPLQVRRILCPVDFSATSNRALAYARSLAEETAARLTVLYVIEVPPELREHSFREVIDVDRARAAAEADCLQRLRELIPDTAHRRCAIETAVLEGPPYHQILKRAADEGSDLIVMGVHGRGAIDLLLFGSNTARVMRAAECPVLIVRGS